MIQKLAEYLEENLPKMFKEGKDNIKFEEKKKFRLFNLFSFFNSI